MMRNSFQNRHSQKFLHRPRYNLPDCLLEDQCRCNSMFLLPQWHLINAKVEPSWCSSHIQVHDARFQEYFLRVIVLHYSATTSSRLANLLNCPQRRFQMNSVVLNIETDLKTLLIARIIPFLFPIWILITIISSDSQCLGRRSWATGVVLQSQMADCLTRCLGWYRDHIEYTIG